MLDKLYGVVNRYLFIAVEVSGTKALALLESILHKLYGVGNRYLSIPVKVSETKTSCFTQSRYKYFLSFEYFSVMKKGYSGRQ